MRRLLLVLALGAAGCSGSSTGTPPAAAPSPSALLTVPPATTAPTSAATSAAPVPAPTAAVPTAAGPRPCSSAHLRLSVREGDSGAGQSHQSLVLTNRGVGCTLHGYPGVSFLDARGRQLGSPADESGAVVRRVLLRPGGSAVAVLTYSNAGAYPDSTCRPTQASRVRVYPPGERVALTAPDPVLVCAATGSRQLHIDPVRAG